MDNGCFATIIINQIFPFSTNLIEAPEIKLKINLPVWCKLNSLSSNKVSVGHIRHMLNAQLCRMKELLLCLKLEAVGALLQSFIAALWQLFLW